MNCLFFSECMSIKCCKNKARSLSRRIRTTKNHWSLKNLIFKAKIWHPGLENARDHVKSNLLRSCSAGQGIAKLRCYQGLLLKLPWKIAFAYNNTVINQWNLCWRPSMCFKFTFMLYFEFWGQLLLTVYFYW